MNYNNHYSVDFNEVIHRDKKLVTSLNSGFEQYASDLRSKTYQVIKIIPGYEHRPDLISTIFYNTAKYDWLIMLFNNIKDPFQELNVGDTILIPNI